jgi:hypothetical protein
MFSPMSGCSVACLAVALLGCAHTRARQSDIGDRLIINVVDDASTKRVDGVSIVLTAESGAELRPQRADRAWVVREVVPGPYLVRVSAPGYVTGATPAPVSLRPAVLIVRLHRGDDANELPLGWSVLTPPAYKGGRDPYCTPAAVDGRAKGLVRAVCVISRSGEVHDCKILDSLPLMNPQVLYDLQHRKYRPAMDGDTAIEVNYEFRLNIDCTRSG